MRNVSPGTQNFKPSCIDYVVYKASWDHQIQDLKIQSHTTTFWYYKIYGPHFCGTFKNVSIKISWQFHGTEV